MGDETQHDAHVRLFHAVRRGVWLRVRLMPERCLRWYGDLYRVKPCGGAVPWED